VRDEDVVRLLRETVTPRDVERELADVVATFRRDHPWFAHPSGGA